MNASATAQRAPIGNAFVSSRPSSALSVTSAPPVETPYDDEAPAPSISPDLFKALADVKGQAQFLLYLADQIEDSLDQLVHEAEGSQATFLCKILAMYSTQLETKHQGLGDRIAETCQEVYVTVREYDGQTV